MDKVTYFDVEFANSKNKSICQIGIMTENYWDGEPYYPELNIYIDPEDGFDDFCIKIHGITKDKIKGAPAFPVVWKEIEKYFTNAVVIGHNVAGADLDALVKTLKRYNLDISELYYVCTLELAREHVPAYMISDYGMSSLCRYFGVDIDSEHDAFDDACACADLFKAILKAYSLDISDIKVKKYEGQAAREFDQFMAGPVARKAISEFYGVIIGFALDKEISQEEVAYLNNWKKRYAAYASQKEFAEILTILNNILADGIVTIDEISELQDIVKTYLDTTTTSPITLATQVLDGILKGIIVDGKVTEKECIDLRHWLYDNIYLADHYPFNRVMDILDKVLKDAVITTEESTYIVQAIKEILDPVNFLKQKVNSVEGKHVCLSGIFEHGSKAAVEEYIEQRGGFIDSNIKKSTDVLVIGNYECQAYTNGTYGTKVKKALEYNEKGCHIQIMKEADLFQ